MSKTFYRVSNILSGQGLWYDTSGIHTGLIHNKFNFCKNKDLPMPYDTSIVGYLSTTDSLDDLWNWFSVEDIKRLQEHDYFIHIYESNDWKHNGLHHLMKQDNAVLIDKIVI